MLEIAVAGDAYDGAERDTFIQNALRDYEQSFASAAAAEDLCGFRCALNAAFGNEGPHMIHIRIQPGSLEQLGRPTVSPDAVARRFKAFLAS